MNNQLRTIVLVDTTGMSSQTVRESWHRLHIANPLRIVSSCAEALSFISRTTAPMAQDDAPKVGALVLDHSAGKQDGLELVEHVRRDQCTKLIPILVYAADIKPLRERSGIAANAFVRRPMALKLIDELDSLCGLSKTPYRPTVGSPRSGPSLREKPRRGDTACRQNRKEEIPTATQSNRPENWRAEVSEH